MRRITLYSMRILSLDEKPDFVNNLRKFLNKCLYRDFITKHMFERVVIKDPNFRPDLVLLAVENDEMKGVLIGGIRTSTPKEYIEKDKNKAWIKAIAINPITTNKEEIFSKLLNEFEERVQGLGRNIIRVSDMAPGYFTPGLDIAYDDYLNLYLKYGFRKVGQCVDYILDLINFKMPSRVLKTEEELRQESIIITEINYNDEVIKWVSKNFSPEWGYEVSLGFKEEEGGVWIAKRDKEILGFSVYGGLEPNWFGPIGVHPAARRKGIGTVLLYRCLESLRLLGKRLVVIPWTGHLFFYTQLPYIVNVRHYVFLEKMLK